MTNTNVCNTCHGRGQTKATATIVREVAGKQKTVQQGSGCPDCLGRGIHGPRREREQG